MKQIQADVWETEMERPFPGLTTHAYLLTRPDGNVLFYSTGHEHEIDRMAELGGVARQYLSHRDEAGEALKTIRQRHGALLCGHAAERDDFAQLVAPDILFEVRERHLGNIDVIPSPGHSPGSTCFLVESPSTGRRYLFIGDTLYPKGDGSWRAGFIPGHSTREDRDTMADSLLMLRSLAPDVVIASAFGGRHGYQELSPASWPALVDQARERLLRQRV